MYVCHPWPWMISVKRRFNPYPGITQASTRLKSYKSDPNFQSGFVSVRVTVAGIKHHDLKSGKEKVIWLTLPHPCSSLKRQSTVLERSHVRMLSACGKSPRKQESCGLSSFETQRCSWAVFSCSSQV